MTVYKGYMKIVKQNKGLILLYLFIFFGITIMFQMSAKKENYSSYQAEKVKIGFVDEDRSGASDGMRSYLEKFHEVLLMEDRPEILQENLFYRNVEYILRIPENFFQKCIVEGEKLPVTKVPGSYTSFYVDQQINSYLNNVQTYYAAGFSEEESVKNAAFVEEAEVTMRNITGNGGEMTAYGFYFRYLPYLFLAVLCYVMGNVLSAFRRGDLSKRMQASAISGRRQSIEGLMAAGTIALALWIVSIGVAVLNYRGDLINSSGFCYYLLNSVMMIFVALSMSYLVGFISQNTNMLNGIVNGLSLGMCFLCGVFVPMSYISTNVKRFSMFLPVYWYEKVNDILTDYADISGKVRIEIFQALGIQLVFAAAFVCITLVVSRRKQNL